jgi:hypothetical protein
MASNFSLPQFLSMGPRFQVMKPMQITAAARTFVGGGKNWDPFSDLNTSMKEFDRFSENVVFHLPSFPLQGIQNSAARILNWINYDFALFSEDAMMLSTIEAPPLKKEPISRS